MKLFENKVGRPSNATLKKRRTFKISLVLGLFAIIFVSLSFVFKSDNSIKLQGNVNNFANDMMIKNTTSVVKNILKYIFKLIPTLEYEQSGDEVFGNKALVDDYGKYPISFKITHEQNTKKYFKWFTYSSLEPSKSNVINYDSCVEMKTSAIFTRYVEVSKKNPDVTGRLVIYNTKSGCQNDKTGIEPVSGLRDQIVYYSKNNESLKNLTIDFNLEKEPNKDNIVFVDTLKEHEIKFTLNNETGKTRYYRTISYNDKLIKKENINKVSACKSYNKTVNDDMSVTLSNKNFTSAARAIVYEDKESCDNDKDGESKDFVNEKIIYYSYSDYSKLLTVEFENLGLEKEDESILETGTQKKDEVLVDTVGTYKLQFKLENDSNLDAYYKWFSYKEDGNIVGECKNYKKTTNAVTNLNVTPTNNLRKGQIKIYKDLNSCQIDTDSKSNVGVVKSKEVTYRLDKVYNYNGWKMIWYDINELTEKIGFQLSGKCFSATLSHSAYIMSDGKNVESTKNVTSSSCFGGYSEFPSSVKELYKYIEKQIDNGIPAPIHVNSKTNQHWVTVVGYKKNFTEKVDKTNIFENLYVIDPYQSTIKGKKEEVLWDGYAKDRSGSIKSLHSDKRVILWDSKKDLKVPTYENGCLKK